MLSGREIGERFIRAVQIMEGLYSSGPSRGSSGWVKYIHTQADMNGWGTKRLEDERNAFWNSINSAPKPWEISQAEETLGWLTHVKDENERLCLTAWARCMATEAIFKDWCKQSRIHPETGRRRKERAILRILLAIDRNPLQHNKINVFDMLPDAPEISDKDANIAIDGPTHWRAEDAKPMACDFDTDLSGFDWADKQNERRRQREAAKRKQAA